MTCEKNTVSRSNFASRLLNKAMSERKTGEFKKPEISASESFAPPAAVQTAQEAVGASK
jgi:hypothetical protein